MTFLVKQIGRGYSLQVVALNYNIIKCQVTNSFYLHIYTLMHTGS